MDNLDKFLNEISTFRIKSIEVLVLKVTTTTWRSSPLLGIA